MLSDNIKILRKKKGYSQETLAEQLHVVRQTISKWVSAKYCYITHELRLHQNDRCKRFTPV